jgi:NO-binding membrane sensor protein with MHYT domain
VGGSIIGHGVTAIHYGIDGLAQRSGGFAWAVSLLGDAAVGVVTGFVALLVVTLVQKVWKGARKAG